MKELNVLSGILIVALHCIAVSGFECVTCDWNAGQTNGTNACVSRGYEQDRQECPNADNNNVYICQTHLTFKMVGTRAYLESLTRGCKLKHFYCNKECSPKKKRDCYLCCGDEGCNSVPFSMGLLPFSLYYNTTSSASPNTYTRTTIYNSLLTAEIMLASFWVLR